MTDDNKPLLTKAQRMSAAAEAAGFRRLPDDHPIYSEGPTITFMSGAQGQLLEKPPKKPRKPDDAT